MAGPMPGRTVFDRQGTRDPNPKETPKNCDECQYTEATLALPGFWDTVHDAGNIYSILRANAIATLWAGLFKNFTCPPEGKKCNIRKSCSSKPAYLEGFAELVKAPDGSIRWQTQVTLGRKIMCVEKGDGKDDVPEVPEPKEPGEEQPPKKPKEGKEPKDAEPPKKPKGDHDW